MNPQSSLPLVVGVSTEALLGQDAPGHGNGSSGPRSDRSGAEPDILPAGSALPLLQALRSSRPDAVRGVELVLLSRMGADAGPRVLESLRSHELPVERTVFTGGASCSRYLSTFDVDLFLTSDEQEARQAAEVGRPVAVVLPRPSDASTGEVRIALDLDDARAEGPGDSSERERDDAALRQLAGLVLRLRGAADAAGSSLRIAWMTSRGSSHLEEAVRTLGRSGLRVDEAFSLAGLPREGVLKAFGAQLLFDARSVAADSEKPESRPSRSREGRPEADDSSAGIETPFSRLRGRR